MSGLTAVERREHALEHAHRKRDLRAAPLHSAAAL
jgi:hypothetical protein